MDHREEQIDLLQRRIAFLREMNELWDDNASIRDVARLAFDADYKDVTTEEEFLKALSDIHERAKQSEEVLF